jgi:hypothetical protein
MPLLKHERAKSMIGDLVKVLLEELEIDCEPLGSTTFKREDLVLSAYDTKRNNYLV